MNNSPPARISGFRAKDWIKISRAPSQVINTQLGDKVELECEVLGSPAPEIQWYKGSQLIQEVIFKRFVRSLTFFPSKNKSKKFSGLPTD